VIDQLNSRRVRAAVWQRGFTRRTFAQCTDDLDWDGGCASGDFTSGVPSRAAAPDKETIYKEREGILRLLRHSGGAGRS